VGDQRTPGKEVWRKNMDRRFEVRWRKMEVA